LRVLFAGTPTFAASHLAGLLSNKVNIVGVITQPDKPGKRGKKPIASEVKKLAEKHNLDIIQPEKLKLADIASFEADILIVVAYGQILRQPVLELPTHGCINVHGSLLPRWRGAAPIQRAILEGDDETGICIIQMDKGLDTGEILSTRRYPLKGNESSLDLIENLPALGIDALLEVLNNISNLEPQKQVDEGATYAHKINKQEALCDWQLPCEKVDQMIRAFNPDPICFSFLGDLRVKLYQAEAVPDIDGKPGDILEVSKKGILVACGSGAILIKRIQLPLGKGSILNGSDVKNARSDILFAGASFSSELVK